MLLLHTSFSYACLPVLDYNNIIAPFYLFVPQLRG